MSDLKKYFENNTENAIDKWIHYFDIYDFWFKKYRNQPIVILEIGVFQGGSLKMWRNYFGKEAKIFAIDINPSCKQFETENTKIFIGSQDDKDFLKKLKSQVPKIDILIDDGGHTMEQQITSFEELYGHIKDDGLYLCEDLHTSYWEIYGGGYLREASFIEYSKKLIDRINSWHIKSKKMEINDFTRSTYSLHYYDSILLIEKKQIVPPSSKMTGKILIPIDSFNSPVKNLTYKKNRMFSKFSAFFKKILRFLFQK